MEVIELGRDIELSGFSGIGGDRFIVVKKVIGNFVKNLQDKNSGFERLSLHLKIVHGKEYELIGKLNSSGKMYNSEVVNFNLFYALNEILRKLEAEAN
tara:strand:+ start:307 stop:600 length:294 start_codon:yes stop_codon:yes gene_type:complete